VKRSEGLSNRKGIYHYKNIYIKYEVCCLYGCFVYHVLSYSFGSIFYHFIHGYMFWMILFNFVSYVFLLLCLCIIIAMHVLLWVFWFTELLYCTTATGCQPKCSEQNIAISKYLISTTAIPYSLSLERWRHSTPLRLSNLEVHFNIIPLSTRVYCNCPKSPTLKKPCTYPASITCLLHTQPIWSYLI
jgi:hypothetical protein